MVLMIALQRQADSRDTFLEDAQMRVGKPNLDSQGI
jgi:hypothetical protein